jgi:ribulose bisphosphate carboxylase small subunit
LSHLIEVGQQMVQEQQRVQKMRLAEEYNKSLYFNRKLGDTVAHPNNAPGNGSSEPAGTSGKLPFSADRNSSDWTGGSGRRYAATSYEGHSSNTQLTPEMVNQVNQILRQGHRLGIEYVDQRRFRTNSWNCYGTFEGNGSSAQPSEALSALESCLNEHSADYIRLVGINPGDRHRIAEIIVQRPHRSL